MPQDRDNNFHSEEAQEILGRIPVWIIRWGITVVFSIFAIIIIGCCFIRYPERVTGTVTITTANSPVDVVVKNGGNLELILVSNGDSVKEGDILGVIHTGANYIDVLSADSCLLTFAKNPPKEGVFIKLKIEFRLSLSYLVTVIPVILLLQFSAFSHC